MRTVFVSLATSAALISGLVASAGAVEPDYTYSTVSIAGEGNTILNGINASGHYTGTACSGNCDKQILFIGKVGASKTEFKLHFADYDPDAPATTAGIDTAGEVVGSYTGPGGVTHAFKRQPGGKLSEFNVPGAATFAGGGTAPEGISQAGVIVGWYVNTAGERRGFIDKSGEIQTYSEPSASAAEGGTEITFYSSGEYGGLYYSDNGAVHGFYVKKGTSHTVNSPKSKDPAKGHGTKLIAIDSDGAFFGYVTAGGVHTTGFADNDGGFTTIADPKQVGQAVTDGTYVDNANGDGTVVGYYTYKESGQVKGFIAQRG